MLGLFRKFTPLFLIGWYHFLLAFLGAFFYGFPGKKLIVIGVTGTNGKSTTVEMIARIFEEAGLKVASQSSIRFRIAGREVPNLFKMTMPGRFFIQKFLRQAVKASCQFAVLEVTSEGILQHRHRFINFNTAVFTNLTPEHIERHGGFENYKKAKGKLFEACKNIHIINSDDPNGEYFLSFPAKNKIKYQMLGEQFSVNGELFSLDLKLLGKFNIYNAAAAIAVGLSHAVSLEVAKRAVEKIESIPGRMELVIKEPFKVFVDYAFTPNALEKVYQTLNPDICVLGACGGGRDKWKRPILGGIAAKHCREIIITNEDPYDENPLDIINQTAKQAGEKAQKILDRREAINKALTLAKPGDTVVITGKGSEPLMCLAGGQKIPWDDREVVKEEAMKFAPSGLSSSKTFAFASQKFGEGRVPENLKP